MTISNIKSRIKQELNAIGLDFERINEEVLNTALDTAFRQFVSDVKNMFSLITYNNAVKIFGDDFVSEISVTADTFDVDLSTLLNLYELHTYTKVRKVEKKYDEAIYDKYDAYYKVSQGDYGTSINLVKGDSASIRMVFLNSDTLSDNELLEIPELTADAITYLACAEICKMPETGLEQYTQNYLALYTRALANATRI